MSNNSERIDALDALRGFALLGILIINIILFGLPLLALETPMGIGGDDTLNYSLWSFTTVFVEGSFRGLFSLMFGASVVLYCQRAESKNSPANVTKLYYRRNVILIIFGVIHGWLLIMPGDILLLYGIASLFLLPFRRLSAGKLIWIASIMLLLITVIAYDEESIEVTLAQNAQDIEQKISNNEKITEEEQQILARWQQIQLEHGPGDAYIQQQIKNRTGDLSTLYKSNSELADVESIELLIWWVADAMMMMIVGMALFKWNILSAARNMNFYLKLMTFAYLIGLTIRIWIVNSLWMTDFAPGVSAIGGFNQIGRVAMTIGHVGLFFVCWKLLSSSVVMRALVAAGRMALTNYIAQTLIANFIFTGIGLGLYGQLVRSEIYLIMIGIWIFQLVFSYWWLKNYRMGPLEWIWRALTYGKRQKLKD